MKQLHLMLIGLSLCLAIGCYRAPSDEGFYTTIQVKVLQVFEFRDGDAIGRAYRARWKDQDIIVDDPQVETDYHVDDTISVHVFHFSSPGAPFGKELLSFHAVPKT